MEARCGNAPGFIPARDSTIVGGWQSVDDSTAASGARLFYPNTNAPKVMTSCRR
jgi:hypothetical protein